MSETRNRKELDKLLRTKIESLSARIQRGDDAPRIKEFVEIEHLGKIVALRDETKKKRPSWVPPAAFLASVFVITLPAALTLSEVSVSFDLVLTGLQFVTKDRIPVIGSIRPEQLEISGVQKVIPPIAIEALKRFEFDNARNIFFKVKDASDSGADLTLERLDPPPSTTISIVHARRPFAFAFAFTKEKQANPIIIGANARGAILVSLPGSMPLQTVDFGIAPKAFQFKGDGGSVDVNVDLRQPPNVDFYPQRVDGVDLNVIEEIPGVAVVPRSTIVSGNLYMDSLDGRKVELRSGERVTFSTLIFQLDTLKFTSDSILVRMHGKVRDLRLGDALETRSLMPTYLQWLIARQPLAAFWGALLSLYGLVYAIFKWYKGQP